MKQKMLHSILITTLMGSLVFLGAGCSKKPVSPPIANSNSNSIPDGTDINYPPADYAEDSIEGTLDDDGPAEHNMGSLSVDGTMDGVSDQDKITRGRSEGNLLAVYFEFDQYLIRGDEGNKMVANAEILSQTSANILVEGNCDERGTNEYNNALGQKRAQSAEQYLIDLGIDSARIRTVSYGEERPLFEEQDELSYEYNRRADFILE